MNGRAGCARTCWTRNSQALATDEKDDKKIGGFIIKSYLCNDNDSNKTSRMNEQKLNLYVIAGCNGAGKTTASFTVLPEMLDCREFVNADEIAAGLSPFNPEGVALQAGRLMIERIIHLLKEGETFAFETTLATRSYVKLIKQAQKRGYFVTLLFFSLSSPEQAVKRVEKRVSEGGHNIPLDVIYRRYDNGLSNLFNLYMPVCDYWVLYDNSICPANKIACGWKNDRVTIMEPAIYERFKDQYDKKTDDERS